MTQERIDQLTAKISRHTTFYIDYNDLENLITEFYNVDEYSIPASEEMGNDSTFTATVDGEQDEFDREDINKFIDSRGRKGSFMTQRLMDDLCAKGIIEKGKYNVRVSW